MNLLCHGRPERCFKINGNPMPICSRCTGVYLGVILGLVLLWDAVWQLYLSEKLLASALIIGSIIPMAVDGTAQLFGVMSNNARRFITGLLTGIGTASALSVIYHILL